MYFFPAVHVYKNIINDGSKTQVNYVNPGLINPKTISWGEYPKIVF